MSLIDLLVEKYLQKGTGSDVFYPVSIVTGQVAKGQFSIGHLRIYGLTLRYVLKRIKNRFIQFFRFLVFDMS